MALFRPNRALLSKNFQYSCAGRYSYNKPETNVSNQIQKRNCSCDHNEVCKGKIAIVTGGSRGIGYHITDYLLKGGCESVIIGSRNVDNCEKTTIEMNEKYGEQRCLFQPLDVKKKEELDKIFNCTKERFGKIDIVVNNSGILKESKWEDTININCFGLVYGTLLGFKHMSVNNGGCGGIVVNVASIVGLQPLFYAPTYSATKHFIVGFTRCIGHDYYYKQTKVKVVAVLPGVTDTDMVRLAKDGGLPQFPGMGEELAKWLGSLPAQGPEEVGKGMITSGMMEVEKVENGSIWVSEGCEFYKVNIPSRDSYKPKQKERPKKPEPCEAVKNEGIKLDPCLLDFIAAIHKERHECKDKGSKKQKDNTCGSHKEDPCKPKKDPTKQKDDKCGSHKEDSCKPKKDSTKPKDDKCGSHKEDPCKPKKDSTKQKDDKCGSHKEDPCKPKKDSTKPKDDKCGSHKEDPCKPKTDPTKQNDGSCGSHKDDPCKPMKHSYKRKRDHSKGTTHQKDDDCKKGDKIPKDACTTQKRKK